MSVTLWIALLLQFATMALLRLGLGKLWLRLPVTLLVLASMVYDGLSQVLLAFPSVRPWDTFRNGIQPGYIDEATLILSAGMLAFTIMYLVTARRGTAGDGAVIAAGALDWRLLALACAPLAVLTYGGRGYNNGNGTLTTGAGAPLASSLAGEFFVILVALAAFGLLLRHGSRWFLPVLVAQSVLLAAAGERTPVIIDAIILIVLLARAGLRPPAGQLAAALALTVAAVLAVTGVRAAQGRDLFYQDSGLGNRVTALGTGLTGGAVPGEPGLAAQAASRLDGTSFTGGILQAEGIGESRLSMAYVPESLLLTVPSAVWPSKLDRQDALNPVLAETYDLGLQRINFLPGLPGLYAGFLAPPWLIAFLAVLGALCGRGERWLLRRSTPARFVLIAGAMDAALCYEKGLPGMLVALRAGLVLAVVVWLAEEIRSRSHARRTPLLEV